MPGLSNSVIVGNDWLTSNQAIIDYCNFAIKIRGRNVPESAVSFSRRIKEKIICEKRSDDFIHIQVIGYDGNKNQSNWSEKYTLWDDEGEIDFSIAHLFSINERPVDICENFKDRNPSIDNKIYDID